MTLDPKKNDAISSVGDDLGDGEYKYNGTIVDIDGWILNAWPNQARHEAIGSTKSICIGDPNEGRFR